MSVDRNITLDPKNDDNKELRNTVTDFTKIERRKQVSLNAIVDAEVNQLDDYHRKESKLLNVNG